MFYAWLIGALLITLIVHQIALRCLKRIKDPSDRLAAATICTVVLVAGFAGFNSAGFQGFDWRAFGTYTMIVLFWQVVGHLRMQWGAQKPEVSPEPPSKEG